MSISDKLTRLQNAKEDIEEAITDNGGTIEEGDGLEEYPTRITTRFNEVNSALQILLKGPTLIEKTITQNGTYLAEDDNADGYSSVLVNVESYTIADAGKVVNSTGTGLVSQTSYGTVTTNGTIDTTLNNSVTVNVPTYSSADNGKVVKNGALSSQTNYGTVTSNGTYTTTYNKSITVNVPNVMSGIYYPLLDYGNYNCSTKGGIVIETSTNIYIMIYGTKVAYSRNAEFTLQSTNIAQLITAMNNSTLDNSIFLASSGQYRLNAGCTVRYSTDISKYGINIETTGDAIPEGYITFMATYNKN